MKSVHVEQLPVANYLSSSHVKLLVAYVGYRVADEIGSRKVVNNSFFQTLAAQEIAVLHYLVSFHREQLCTVLNCPALANHDVIALHLCEVLLSLACLDDHFVEPCQARICEVVLRLREYRLLESRYVLVYHPGWLAA